MTSRNSKWEGAKVRPRRAIHATIQIPEGMIFDVDHTTGLTLYLSAPACSHCGIGIGHMKVHPGAVQLVEWPKKEGET